MAFTFKKKRFAANSKFVSDKGLIKPRRRSALKKGVYEAFVRPVTVRLMNRYFVGNVKGLENIPKDKPAILAANHQSYFDFLIIPSVIKDKRVHIIAAQELASHPFVGVYARNDECVLVDRNNPGIKFYKDSIKILKSNNLLLIFPEGTRSADGSISPFKRAFVELARISGAVIIPTAIKGTRDILPKGGKRIKLNKCTVAFGLPVHVDKVVDDKTDKKRLQQISDNIRQTVVDLIKEA